MKNYEPILTDISKISKKKIFPRTSALSTNPHLFQLVRTYFIFGGNMKNFQVNKSNLYVNKA